MSTSAIRAALDAAEQHATAEVWVGHPLAIILEALIKQTRAALAAEPVEEGSSDEDLLRTYGKAKRDHCYEGDIDDWPKKAERAATVAGLRAVLSDWGRPAAPPAPEAAEPVGDGPSAADLLPVEPPNIQTTIAMQYRSAWREGVEDGWNEARAVLTRWARPAAPPATRPEGDWFAVAMIAQDMRSRGLAEQACGDELLKLANSNRHQPSHLATPPPLPPDYIDPEHHGEDRELLEVFYRACAIEGGTADEIHLRGIRAVRAARFAALAAPETPAEALAARPLLEQVARLGDCIGANTVGQIMAISSCAAAWLRENPPGQPVRIEPRGCPTPGACSCVEPTLAPPKTTQPIQEDFNG